MCTSVVPLRCHVASSTPQRPHLCCTSSREFMTYGMHPRQKRQQRPKAQALIPLVSTSTLFAGIGITGTYWVVFPTSKAQFVIALCPQAGQSAGAGLLFSEAMGVAFW